MDNPSKRGRDAQVAAVGFEEFRANVDHFCHKLPRIFEAHHVTADLVPRVAHLLDAANTPFTVAVVGQMRSGKSSLLNALIADDLAVTGVTETTATLNWFKYAPHTNRDFFRVVWRDRPAEDLPRDAIKRWVGDSDRAATTRYIEHYSDAEFLKEADIVDTPGTRSVLQNHERVIQDFLALQLDRETRRQGGMADAIIYVVFPVARGNDRQVLEDFGQKQRLPGACPYNSIAVIHKWEKDFQSMEQAEAAAARIAAVMQRLVSVAIPVSAPLARAAESFPTAFWSDLLELTANTPSEVLKTLLKRDGRFTKNEARCPLSANRRRELIADTRLPWSSFKVIVQLAMSQQPSSPEDLQRLAHEQSGIDKLRHHLRRRFFSRAGALKGFSILSKACEASRIAEVRLRNHKTRYVRLHEKAQRASDDLSSSSLNDSRIETVRTFVAEGGKLVEEELRRTNETQQVLADAAGPVEAIYQDLEQDFLMLDIVDSHMDDFEPEVAERLRTLFGAHGSDPSSRLAKYSGPTDGTSIPEGLLQAVEDFNRQAVVKPRQIGKVFAHAALRCEQLLQYL